MKRNKLKNNQSNVLYMTTDPLPFELTRDLSTCSIIDNFYQNPDAIRQRALSIYKGDDLRFWKGKRSPALSYQDILHIKSRFEEILGIKITKEFRSHFHVHTAEDPLVYHSDQLRWAAVVYLTPDAPVECGTNLWKSKLSGLRDQPTHVDVERHGKSVEQLIQETYTNALLDRSKWEMVDQFGNVYNRCVIWNGTLPHSVAGVFGHNDETGRLVQLFFFE